MFWSDPSRAVQIILWMLVFSVVISLVVYIKTKKKLLSIFLLSLLGYLSLYLNVDSRIFDIYNLKWIVKFTLWYWPWINVALLAVLLVNYFRNRGKA